MTIKVGDKIIVTKSTLNNNLVGQVLTIIAMDESSVIDNLPYRVAGPNSNQWVNGILATELNKALS